MLRSFFTLLFFVPLALFLAAQAPVYTPDWSSLDSRPTPEWWLDAKFGIFIHWGVYSVPAYTTLGNYAEWYQNSLEKNLHDGKIRDFHQKNFGSRTYYDLADDFHASLWEPDEWARLFEKAGARYVVLTSKHHDGYCLWPNEQASATWGFPWSSDVRGPKRDLVGDLFSALRKTSVKPGFYFSLYEWFNPLWKSDQARYAREHAMPQLYELVNKYQPWVVWSDGDWDATPDVWQSPQFLAWLYTNSPVRDRVVANDRWGSGVRFHHGGIYTPEYQPDLDFEDHAWEESRGMGFSYGYNRAENAWDYNSTQSLVLHLVDKASRGGNFLLDIGPDGHGMIPPIMQERLLDIGQWLSINGEAIYGTRRWRTPCQWSEGRRDWKAELVDGWKTSGDALLKQTIDPAPGFAVKEVFFTYNPKSNALYAVLPKYPDDKKLVLKDLQLPAGTEVTFLATKEKLRWENSPGKTTVFLPEYNPNKIKSPHAFAVKIANFGAFVPKPQITVNYDPSTMAPTVQIGSSATGVTIRYTTDGSDPKPSSAAFEKPFSPTKECVVRAKAYKTGLLESNDASAEVLLYAQKPSVQFVMAPQPGLSMALMTTREKYTSENVQNGFVETSGVAPDFSLHPLCVSSKCGMVWNGYINIPETGGYQFWTESDDGSVLYIDNEIVVDNDGDHGMEEKTGLVNLQKGWHKFKLIYYNVGGGYGLKVRYAPLGKERQEIPGSMLGH
ncbi:MAG: alpha-L-fucosidase [Saprospiraceae bacterium]|nr:alpha-L-fucosidase [Saprospiraceae bacterium]